MKTKFFELDRLIKLRDGLSQGKKESINTVIDELQRLKTIIKDYELGIEMLQNKYESDIYKNPS